MELGKRECFKTFSLELLTAISDENPGIVRVVAEKSKGVITGITVSYYGPALADGIKQLSEEFNIKNIVPINVLEDQGQGSATKELLVFVVPKEKQEETKERSN